VRELERVFEGRYRRRRVEVVPSEPLPEVPVAQVPRIRRAEPSGPATQPQRGIPILARLVWHDGSSGEVEALAVAWTAAEVEIEWTTPWGQRRRDWIRADQVRRRWPDGERE
jgi:hypothetical protein